MRYFKFAEFLKSTTADRRGIQNFPTTTSVIENLITLGDNVLDPLRSAMGFPIIISSGFRCPELNEAVGGAKNSYHLQGRAADIDCGNMAKNKKVYDFLYCHKCEGTMPIKELLWEGGGKWVHVAI